MTNKLVSNTAQQNALMTNGQPSGPIHKHCLNICRQIIIA